MHGVIQNKRRDGTAHGALRASVSPPRSLLPPSPSARLLGSVSLTAIQSGESYDCIGSCPNATATTATAATIAGADALFSAALGPSGQGAVMLSLMCLLLK